MKEPINILLTGTTGRGDKDISVADVLANVAAMLKVLDHDGDGSQSEANDFGCHLVHQTCIDALDYLQRHPAVSGARLDSAVAVVPPSRETGS